MLTQEINFVFEMIIKGFGSGCAAQSVTCLTADTCLSADPVCGSLILARPHTYVEIDHEIISMAFFIPSDDSRRIVVSYKRKYVHEVLVNHLFKLAQENKCG